MVAESGEKHISSTAEVCVGNVYSQRKIRLKKSFLRDIELKFLTSEYDATEKLEGSVDGGEMVDFRLQRWWAFYS